MNRYVWFPAAAPMVPDSPLKTLFLMIGYGLAAMVLGAAISGGVGVVSAGVGAIMGVLLFRWHVQQSLRLSVPMLLGIVAILCGLLVPAGLARGGFIPRIIGITATLVTTQILTLALIGMGLVLVVRSLSCGSRLLATFDGLAIVTAICLRFAPHRNFQWGQPRFLADWAGIRGYDLPLLFAILGLAALMIGLTAVMRHTKPRHAVNSIVSVLILLLMLLWLGSRFLQNPTPEIVAENQLSPLGSKSSATNLNEDSGTSNSLNNAISSNSSNSSNRSNGSSKSSKSSNSKDSSSDDSSSESDTDGGTSASSSRNQSSNDPLPKAANQRNSPQPIALVLLEDDLQPNGQAWYFRQTAVSLFNGNRLVTAADAGLDDDLPNGFSPEEVLIAGIPLPENMHRIISLVVNLITEQPRPFSLPSMISYAPLPNPDADFFRQSYRAVSCVLTDQVDGEDTFSLMSVLLFHQPGSTDWDRERFEHYLLAPKDPRYKELADEIVATQVTARMREDVKDSAMMKALAIKRWIEKNTTYSDDPKFEPSGVNPAEQFLFGSRHGYCVHIAHASVYLLRSLGIPARIGVGYMVPIERSGRSSSILIQSTDAHAWPEIYLQDAGWIVVDAFPEKIDESTQFPPEPDPTVGKFLADKARNKDDHKSQLREQRKHGRSFPIRLRHLPWLLPLVVLLIYGIKAWILVAPRFVNPDAVIRATQRATVLRLAEIGIHRRFGETRTEFAERIGTNFPEFAYLTKLHLRQSYGRSVGVPRANCLAIQHQTSCRARKTSSLFRRLLGRLDPRFWVLVR